MYTHISISHVTYTHIHLSLSLFIYIYIYCVVTFVVLLGARRPTSSLRICLWMLTFIGWSFVGTNLLKT